MRFRVIVMPMAEGDIAGIIRYIADGPWTTSN